MGEKFRKGGQLRSKMTAVHNTKILNCKALIAVLLSKYHTRRIPFQRFTDLANVLKTDNVISQL